MGSWARWVSAMVTGAEYYYKNIGKVKEISILTLTPNKILSLPLCNGIAN